MSTFHSVRTVMQFSSLALILIISTLVRIPRVTAQDLTVDTISFEDNHDDALQEPHMVSPFETDSIIEQSESAETELRKKAAQILENVSADQIIPVLTNALQDPDIQVHKAAAHALGEIGSDDAVIALLNALQAQTDNSHITRYQDENRYNTGHPELDASMYEILTISRYSSRSYIAYILGTIGSDEIVFPLIETLQNGNRRVRLDAAYVLGNIDSDEAILPLIKSLDESDSSVRQSIVNSLENISLSRDIDPRETVPYLIGLLKENRPENKIQLLFGRPSRPSSPHPWVQNCANNDKEACKDIINVLGLIGSEDAIDTLFLLLENHDSKIKFATISALRKIGPEVASMPILNFLNHYVQRRHNVQSLHNSWLFTSRDERESRLAYSIAIKFLGELRAENAVPTLASVLKNEHLDYLHQDAVNALGEIRTEDAISSLMLIFRNIPFILIQETLNDRESSEEMRNSALELFKEIGYDVSVPAIISVSNAPDSGASWVLSQIGEPAIDPRAISFSLEHPMW